MEIKMICIACPNGCHLTIDDKSYQVSGNKCPKGITFAQEELLAPKRGVSSLVKTSLPEYAVVSVRTSQEIAKSQIFDLMRLLDSVVIKDYLPLGSVVLSNVFQSGVDVITTTNMKKKEE